MRNRVQHIQRSSKPTQWHCFYTIPSLADFAPCSVPAAMLSKTTWLKGPMFQLQVEELPASDLINPDSDVEVRAHITNLSNDGTGEKLVRAISLLIHIIKSCKAASKDQDQTCSKWHYCKQPCTAEELT